MGVTYPRLENQGNPFTFKAYDVTSTYEEAVENYLFDSGHIYSS